MWLPISFISISPNLYTWMFLLRPCLFFNITCSSFQNTTSKRQKCLLIHKVVVANKESLKSSLAKWYFAPVVLSNSLAWYNVSALLSIDCILRKFGIINVHFTQFILVFALFWIFFFAFWDSQKNKKQKPKRKDCL